MKNKTELGWVANYVNFHDSLKLCKVDGQPQHFHDKNSQTISVNYITLKNCFRITTYGMITTQNWKGQEKNGEKSKKSFKNFKALKVSQMN